MNFLWHFVLKLQWVSEFRHTYYRKKIMFENGFSPGADIFQHNELKKKKKKKKKNGKFFSEFNTTRLSLSLGRTE